MFGKVYGSAQEVILIKERRKMWGKFKIDPKSDLEIWKPRLRPVAPKRGPLRRTLKRLGSIPLSNGTLIPREVS